MMNWRRHLIEAATLAGMAVLCALVANAMAGRDRKLALNGNYQNAAPRPSQQTTTVAPPIPTATQQPSNPATLSTTTSATPIPNTKHPLNPTPQPATAVVVQTDQFPPHPDKPYIEIAYDAVKQLHAKGALFLDARRSSVYEQGHIAGARPFSVWESDIDDKVNKLFEERGDARQQAEPIVVYCSGGDCEDSHMLAQKLWGIQYNNVYVYKDGFPDWQKHGAAAHTGAAP